MKAVRTILVTLLGVVCGLLVESGVALAQTPLNPTINPVKNNSPLGPLGKLPSLAAILGLIGALVVVVIVINYMRYAPRFARDEESKVVRADRVQIGRELPRRNVDISKAAPVIVGPPALPLPVGAPAAPPPPTPAAAPVTAAPAPIPAAPPATPAATPATAPTPVTPAAPAPATPAAAPSAERQEVTMDQAVFDKTLQELLDAGTDRRVAEGRARRAGMMAAKKAAGEG